MNTAGRGGIFKKGESTNVIQQARIRKTKAFFENRQAFLNELTVEIIKTKTKAEKQGEGGATDVPREQLSAAPLSARRRSPPRSQKSDLFEGDPL